MGEDYIDQLMASGQGTTMGDIVQMVAKPKELSPLARQLLVDWQGLGTNVGIGSAGTDRAEIGGRLLADVAEDFAQRLSKQGITDITQAKFAPGAQASWTPEGKGNVSLVATEGGKLIPIWGSSSDASKIRNVALALGSAWLAPGLSAALGGGLTGAAGAGALLGGTRAAVTGGDILKGALTGGVTGGIGQLASPYLADLGKTASQAVGGDMLGKIASGAVQGAGRSALGAAMTGDSIVDALLSGAAGGATSAGADILVKGTNATLGQYLKDVPAPVRNAVTSAATAGLFGKDIEKAAINSLVGSLMNELPSAKEVFGTTAPGVKTLDATTQKLLDIFKTPQDTGRVLGQVAGEIPSGMFDTNEGGSGDDYGDLPSWALDPYKTVTNPGAMPSDDVIEDIENLLLRYENQGFADLSSDAVDQVLEITGRRDNMDIDPWLQPFVDTERRINVTEGEPQTIEVTGKRVNPEGVIIPDWDVLSPAVDPLKSIRDIGSVTKINPDEKLEGTETKEMDLVAGLTSDKVETKKTDTKTTTPVTGTKTTTPVTPGSGLDLSALFAMMGAMANQQQPTRTATGTSLARGTPESPFGLMYKLRG